MSDDSSGAALSGISARRANEQVSAPSDLPEWRDLRYSVASARHLVRRPAQALVTHLGLQRHAARLSSISLHDVAHR